MGLDSLSLGALLILSGIVFLPLALAVTTESGNLSEAEGDGQDCIAGQGQSGKRIFGGAS